MGSDYGPRLSCPRCGLDQPANPACGRCGVVFAKLHSRPAWVSRAPVAPPRSSASSGLWWILAAGAALAVGLVALPAGAPGPSAPIPAESETRGGSPPPVVGADDAPSAAPADRNQPPPTLAPPPPAPQFPPDSLLDETPEAQTAAEPAPTPEPTLQPPTPPPFIETSEWMEGADGYASAARLSRSSGRPMVIYVYTDWCGYCRELERELLNMPNVDAYLQDLVKVKVNPEKGAAEAALATRYGAHGYPTLLIESPSTGRIVRVSRYVSGGGQQRLMTPAEFVESCRRAAGG